MNEGKFSAELAAHFLPVRPDWLAGGEEEEIIEPELPIVDAHHHLFEMPDFRYLLPELKSDLGTGHNIAATVFVECRTMYRADGPAATASIGETEFANGAAAMSASGFYGSTRIHHGIVGNVDLTLGEAASPVLEAHIAAGGERFRGIRNVSAWHASDQIRATSADPPPELLMDPVFRKGFACLAPLGLTFDAWILHTQIHELTDLATAFPDTVVILDHIGGPIGVGPYSGRRDEVFADWRKSVADLARCPNARIKLGGLAMRVMGFDFHEKARPPGSAELAEAWRPYVETAIEAFGSERCMFESNFPVDKGMCSYRTLWNAFKRIVSGASADERAALFHGTACRTYKLELPS